MAHAGGRTRGGPCITGLRQHPTAAPPTMGLSCPIAVPGTVEGRVQAGGAGKPPGQHEPVMEGGPAAPGRVSSGGAVYGSCGNLSPLLAAARSAGISGCPAARAPAWVTGYSTMHRSLT